MGKYGLQLRKPPAGPPPSLSSRRPPLPPPASSFREDEDEDEDEDGVEREISRQASKNRALQKIEEQHKKALEEDPSVFDYDGVYDEMKQQIAHPKLRDRTARKSKYIEKLMEKAKEREREHEVIYERKLLKERSKDDHLFADKEKFVTSAYKRKLEEQAKWLEEDRRRQILEEREDVTKKKDLSDFYFGLEKNVSFGARVEDEAKERKSEQASDSTHGTKSGLPENETLPMRPSEDKENVDDQAETSPGSQNQSEHHPVNVPVAKDASLHEKTNVEQVSANQMAEDHYKRSEDALAAARERFLARKRARVE